MMEETYPREPKSPSMLRSSMSYGLFTAIALILFTVIFYVMGQLANPWLSYLSYMVLIIGLWFGIKGYREEKGGYLSYGQGLATGVLTGLFAGMIASFFSVLLYHVIDPGAMQQLLIAAELRILERMPDITDAQLEQALHMNRVMMRPAILFFIGTLSYTFMALLFSLVIAAFIKRQPSLDE